MDGQTNGGVFNPRNLSLFTYTYNNPVNLVDPDGFAPESFWQGAVQIYDGVTSIPETFERHAQNRSDKANMASGALIFRVTNGGGGAASKGKMMGRMFSGRHLPKFNMSKLSPTMQKNFNRTYNRLLEGGKRPSAKALRSNWGITYKNKGGHLPKLGKGGYKEFKIAGPSNAKNDNVFRMVVGKNGKMYYSNTHYGQNKDVSGKTFYEAGQLSKEQTQQIFKNNAGK